MKYACKSSLWNFLWSDLGSPLSGLQTTSIIYDVRKIKDSAIFTHFLLYLAQVSCGGAWIAQTINTWQVRRDPSLPGILRTRALDAFLIYTAVSGFEVIFSKLLSPHYLNRVKPPRNTFTIIIEMPKAAVTFFVISKNLQYSLVVCVTWLCWYLQNYQLNACCITDCQPIRAVITHTCLIYLWFRI